MPATGARRPMAGELLSSGVIRLVHLAEVTMVQRYPSSGNSIEPQQPPAPRSVVNAVKLMYTGAAISTVSLIVTLADVGAVKSAIKRAKPAWTAAQVNSYDRFIISLAIISGLIGIGLWLWMARANSRGKNWARIVSSVLFGLATLDLIGVFTEPKTALGLVFPLLTWLVGLGAIILLWRGENNDFYQPMGRYDSSLDARVKPPSGLG
jgi:hypothetical protein